MTYQMTVSPDFPPQQVAAWYIFNTWLQKASGLSVHLEMYPDFSTQRAAIQEDKVDLIYANPYDAAMLVREKGFVALARPRGKADEAVIVARGDAPFANVEDLQPGLRLVATVDPAIYLLGMMMLEPAEIDEDHLRVIRVESYPAAAKRLLRGEADLAFFAKEAYENLSSLTREQLKVLVDSQIGDLFHAFLVGPRLHDRAEALRTLLLDMENTPKGRDALDNLGFGGWEPVSLEEAEFMINLIEALK